MYWNGSVVVVVVVVVVVGGTFFISHVAGKAQWKAMAVCWLGVQLDSN